MKRTYREWTTARTALLQSLIPVSVCALVACGGNDSKQVKTEVPSVAVPLPAHTDTLTIDSKAAVLYQPGSVQMQKRMQAVGEEDFRAGAGDYIYYMNTSSEFLEKQGLRVVDVGGKNYMRFVSSDKTAQLIKLDTLPELWGIYFFEPGKKPYLADITMIEEEYAKYYQ